MNDSCFDVPSSASDAVERTNVTAVRGNTRQRLVKTYCCGDGVGQFYAAAVSVICKAADQVSSDAWESLEKSDESGDAAK